MYVATAPVMRGNPALLARAIAAHAAAVATALVTQMKPVIHVLQTVVLAVLVEMARVIQTKIVTLVLLTASLEVALLAAMESVKLQVVKIATLVQRIVTLKQREILKLIIAAVKVEYAEAVSAAVIHIHALKLLLHLTAAEIMYASSQKMVSVVNLIAERLQSVGMASVIAEKIYVHARQTAAHLLVRSFHAPMAVMMTATERLTAATATAIPIRPAAAHVLLPAQKKKALAVQMELIMIVMA